jgi:hypothetical protein
MIKWILEHLGIVVVLFVFLSQIVRALLQARKTASHREVKADDGSEERRVREVQEQIRRQIAARRRGESSTEAPPPLPAETVSRPIPRPQTTQMPEPFGGPLGRMLEELQRKAQQHLHSVPPPQVLVEKRNNAEIERQAKLADELRAVEDTRLLVKRRAVHLASDKAAEAQSEPALRSVVHDRILGDLRDPHSLRRAIMLREVLGPPVALR